MIRAGALPAREATPEQWQRKAALIVNKLREGLDRAGPTAARPAQAYVGMSYFDTDLDRPIWKGAHGWVTADGSAA